MPSGKVHTAASLTLASVVGLMTLADTLQPPFAYPAMLGAVAGTVMTPDLDVDNGCIAFSNMQYALGVPASRAWKAIWYPYAVIVKHRSWISHLPLVSTLIRFTYLYGIMLVVGLIFGFRIPIPTSEPFETFLAFLALSDLLHIVMDVLPFKEAKK